MSKKLQEVTYHCIYPDCNREFPNIKRLEKHLNVEYRRRSKQKGTLKVNFTRKEIVGCFCCKPSDIARTIVKPRKVSAKTIIRDIQAGKLRAHKSGLKGNYHILLSDAFRYMNMYKVSWLEFNRRREYKTRTIDKYRRASFLHAKGMHHCCKLALKSSLEH